MKGTGVVGLRTKGEVEGGGTEKTEKEIAVQPALSRYLFRHQPTCFQKGLVMEGAPCPLPTGVIKPGNQPVVHHFWVPNPQMGLLPMRPPVYRNLPLQPVPSGISLGSREIKVRIL